MKEKDKQQSEPVLNCARYTERNFVQVSRGNIYFKSKTLIGRAIILIYAVADCKLSITV